MLLFDASGEKEVSLTFYEMNTSVSDSGYGNNLKHIITKDKFWVSWKNNRNKLLHNPKFKNVDQKIVHRNNLGKSVSRRGQSMSYMHK